MEEKSDGEKKKKSQKMDRIESKFPFFTSFKGRY